MKILSFDVDLNRIHAWSSTDGRVCYNATDIPWEAVQAHDLILMEVSSPLFYSDDGAECYNRAKWALYNAMTAGRLFQFIQGSKPFLVASSSDWTLGHSEDMRASVAGVVGDNHDLRECRCMQFYHRTNPGKWKPFLEFYASLSTKGKTNGSKNVSRRRSGRNAS